MKALIAHYDKVVEDLGKDPKGPGHNDPVKVVSGQLPPCVDGTPVGRASGRKSLPLIDFLEAHAKACFVAGTPLLVPGGVKAIEQFRVGDLVLSRDEWDAGGAVSAKEVEAVFVTTALVYNLTAGGQTIGTTAEHPFWTERKGWKPANELVPGDVLLGHDGQRVEVQAVEATADVATVYNLRVADHHTYFVGRDEWGFSLWAHNAYVGFSTYNAAQCAIIRYREDEGLPEFDQGEKSTGTVAVLRVGRNNHFAAVGNGKWGNESYPVEDRRRWLAMLQLDGLLPSTSDLSKHQDLSHAEAMSLMEAVDEEGRQSVKNHDIHIFVDRVTCGLCTTGKGLVALVADLQLASLTITDHTGHDFRINPSTWGKKK